MNTQSNPAAMRPSRAIARTISAAACLLIAAGAAAAQERGNQNYQRESGNQIYGSRNPSASIPLAGDLLLYDPKDGQPAPYVEAFVLMNVRPDAFVAVFGVAAEGPSAAESNRKVDATVASLMTAAGSLGIRREDAFVDFITQTPVYDFSVSGRTSREALTGFQTKKTVSFRYVDRAVFEKLVAAAAQAGVYDLIKVDAVVSDMAAARARLFEEATRVASRKISNYNSLLGIPIKAKAVSEERYAAYAPGDRYQTYTAYEAGEASTSRVVERRKTSTSYYDPLTNESFDAVVGAAGIEPTVQLTLFLKVRCQWVQP